MVSAAHAQTARKAYLVAMGDEYEVVPIVSVGDTRPITGDAARLWQMTGIPDGLSGFANRDGTRTVYMNHEFRFDTSTEFYKGESMLRGAYVSKLTFTEDAELVSSDLAYESVWLENAPVGPPATEDNETPAFGRFCSMTQAGKAFGFDRRIVFTNEETDAPMTFDPLGGSTVAIYSGEAHALPRLGHFAKENALPMRLPKDSRTTAIVSLEDGPATPDSQLYLYVGTQDHGKGASPLARNGLDNGELYVLVSDDPTKIDEATFTEGSLATRWVEIPDAGTLSDVDLEAAADAAGAIGFVRMEDGAFSKTHPNELFFATTGSANETAGNRYGRIYQLRMDAADPTGAAKLKIIHNSDTALSRGPNNTALGPDNMDTSEDYLMVLEGGNGNTRSLLPILGRDYGLWRFPLVNKLKRVKVDVEHADLVAKVNPPGHDEVTFPPGAWEPSGIFDASALFGEDTWLLTVQAHPPTTAPGDNTFQDGQLLLLRPNV
jgi:hypothetical protein